MKKLILLAALILMSFPAMVGCSTLHYKTVTPEGREVYASSWSLFHDTTGEGWSYDSVNGILKLEKVQRGPDKETLKAFFEALAAAAGLAK